MAGSEFPDTENEDTENEDTEDPQQLEKTRKMDHAGYLTRSCWRFIVDWIECFYVNDEPESKFLYAETIKLYCIVTQPQGHMKAKNIQSQLKAHKLFTVHLLTFMFNILIW